MDLTWPYLIFFQADILHLMRRQSPRKHLALTQHHYSSSSQRMQTILDQPSSSYINSSSGFHADPMSQKNKKPNTSIPTRSLFNLLNTAIYHFKLPKLYHCALLSLALLGFCRKLFTCKTFLFTRLVYWMNDKLLIETPAHNPGTEDWGLIESFRDSTTS